MNPIVAYSESAVIIAQIRAAEATLQSTLERAALLDFAQAGELGKAIEQAAAVRTWFTVWQEDVAKKLP